METADMRLIGPTRRSGNPDAVSFMSAATPAQRLGAGLVFGRFVFARLAIEAVV
jgi:hypothetical protein